MAHSFPPMLARRHPDGVRRPGPSYRSTIDARRAYKRALLTHAADYLDATTTAFATPAGSAFGLTMEQEISVRRGLAKTLRTRAARGGRFT